MYYINEMKQYNPILPVVTNWYKLFNVHEYFFTNDESELK